MGGEGAAVFEPVIGKKAFVVFKEGAANEGSQEFSRTQPIVIRIRMGSPEVNHSTNIFLFNKLRRNYTKELINEPAQINRNSL